jgi:hypothetical protein
MKRMMLRGKAGAGACPGEGTAGAGPAPTVDADRAVVISKTKSPNEGKGELAQRRV